MKKKLLTVASMAVFAITALHSANVITEKSIDATIGKLTLEQKARLLVGTSGRNDGLSHIVPELPDGHSRFRRSEYPPSIWLMVR